MSSRCGMLRVLGDVFGCMLSSFSLVFLCTFLSRASFFLYSFTFSGYSSFFPTASSFPTRSQNNSLFFFKKKNRVSRRKGTLLGRLSFLLVILLILANILITTLLTTASMANYPGGHALALVHSLHPRPLHKITKREFLFLQFFSRYRPIRITIQKRHTYIYRTSQLKQGPPSFYKSTPRLLFPPSLGPLPSPRVWRNATGGGRTTKPKTSPLNTSPPKKQGSRISSWSLTWIRIRV